MVDLSTCICTQKKLFGKKLAVSHFWCGDVQVSVYYGFEDDESLDNYCVTIHNMNDYTNIHIKSNTFLFLIRCLKMFEQTNIDANFKNELSPQNISIKWVPYKRSYRLKCNDGSILISNICVGELIKLERQIPEGITDYRHHMRAINEPTKK